MSRKTWIILAVLVLALGGTLTWLVTDENRGSNNRPRSATTRQPTTLPPTTIAATMTTTLPGTPLPLMPRPTRIAWTGDSVAGSLRDAMIAEGRARGMQVLDRTTAGCGMVRGVPADDSLAPISFAQGCDEGVPPQLVGTAALQPEVVTWLSTWETANRIVDGQTFRFGTPEADAKLLELINESVELLSANGARVVLLTIPPNTTGPRRPVANETLVRGALHFNALLRQYVLEHPDVSILDFAAMVCPGGPPCPTEVEGVTLRPEDGGHFAGDGPAWVAPRVFDALFGPT
jgi:hypothetical protein